MTETDILAEHIKLCGETDRKKVKEYILKSNKPCKYTFGFAFKNPTIYKVEISKEKALEIIEKATFLDATETEDYIHLNEFSSNDMW